MSDIIARRLFHVGQSCALWFAFVLVQLVCFWLRRCFFLSRMLFSSLLAKTDPTHIHQVLAIGGSKLCFIISPALRQVMVLISWLKWNSGWSAHVVLYYFFFTTLFRYKNKKQHGVWLVHTCPDSQKIDSG